MGAGVARRNRRRPENDLLRVPASCLGIDARALARLLGDADHGRTQQAVVNLVAMLDHLDHRTGRLIVISCLDNLVKGAAGQAVQNMNLMCQLPQETALESLAVYP